MAKSANQKLKLLYIIKILEEKTDESHALNTSEIIAELEKHEIAAERKSIYNDMHELCNFGYDIIHNKTKENGGYYLGSRNFEIAELKLLVDAVQASKFITQKKSKDLIRKIEGLVSVHDAKQLQRQVFVTDRIKTANESIYYNVDYIHKAIQTNKAISFKYFEWTVDKQMRFRKEGEKYIVSPFLLIWKEENYYMVAYDSEQDMLKHYRVDKMNELTITQELRQGNEVFSHYNPANYSNRNFSMFGGGEETVSIQFPNSLIGVVIDRFGKEIDIRKREEEFFSIRVSIAVSTQFYGWITGLGKGVTILGPENVRSDYQKYLKSILKEYNKNENTQNE